MKKGIGCGTILSFIIVIGLISILIAYWWIALAILIVGIVILVITKILSISSFSKQKQYNKTERSNMRTQTSSTYSKKMLPKEVIHNDPTEWDVIPYDILNLLWFYDGPRKNISDTEPSAISIRLPISHNKPEPLPYWPSYQEMSPEQRGMYLNWLKDIDQPIDIGYVFTFFYGIERQILVGNIDNAVAVINRLKQKHDQSSFNSYSDNTLIFAALKKHDPNILKLVNPKTTDLKNLILSKGYFSNKLTSADIVRISKDVGWENTRYIKMYPEKFEKSVSDTLIEKFGNPFFEIPRNLSNVPVATVYLSNVFLDKNKLEFEQDGFKITYSVNTPLSIDIPDFSQASEIQQPLLTVLMTAHEKTKKQLHELRKNGEAIPKTSHKSKQKIINGRTGYPMSTEKSIYTAKNQLEMTKEAAKYNSNMNEADVDYFEGDLHYKKGDWDKAEQSWLNSINERPSLSTEKLAIMYRKENRFDDEVNIIKRGISIVNDSDDQSATPSQLNDRLSKAIAYRKKHKKG